MQKKAITLLCLFAVFLFTPSFVMLVDKNNNISMVVNEIEEEASCEKELAEKEFIFFEVEALKKALHLNGFHEHLNKDAFIYIRHYIDEEVPPPEFS